MNSSPKSPVDYVETSEQRRLNAAREEGIPWKKWGPYLSERQWGTVREDYSQDGNAWDYFSHDQARSRAYHWGEDGLAGISDDAQLLSFSVANVVCKSRRGASRNLDCCRIGSYYDPVYRFRDFSGT